MRTFPMRKGGSHSRASAMAMDESSHVSTTTLPPIQSFRQKRRHTKSRNGCISCKQRKVKVGTVLHASTGQCSPTVFSVTKPCHNAGCAWCEACAANMPVQSNHSRSIQFLFSELSLPKAALPHHRWTKMTRSSPREQHRTRCCGNTTLPMQAKQLLPQARTLVILACGRSPSLL